MSQIQNLSLAEETVIVNALNSKLGKNELLARLTPADFTSQKLAIICNAIFEMDKIGTEINLVTLVEFLKTKQLLESIGGFDFLKSLNSAYVSDANSGSYINAVEEKSLITRMGVATNKAADIVKNGGGSIYDRMHQAEQEILSVSKNFSKGGFESSDDFIDHVAKKRNDFILGDSKHTGLSTGFKILDEVTSGFQNSDYIILAARPSMGKTALALNLFKEMASKNNKPIALFSLEMPTEQIVNRLISSIAQVPLQRIKRPKELTNDEINRINIAEEELKELPLYINQNAGITIGKLVSEARKLHAELNGELSCIIVDYLTLIRTSKPYQSYVMEVGEISSQLKKLARELNIPVIVLSQLSRAVEKRESKVPMMSDLRDSGSIEQDADMVIFLYSDDYYKKNKSQESENQLNHSVTITDVIIAKHRNGPTTKFRLIFYKETGVFKQA